MNGYVDAYESGIKNAITCLEFGLKCGLTPERAIQVIRETMLSEVVS